VNQFWKIIGLGVVAVLALAAASSFASIALGFPYRYASAGSVLIYTTVGYLTFRRWGLVRAVAAAVIVEVVDATLGWFISFQIGIGALPVDQVTIPIIATTMVFVFIFAAVCAVIGAAIARMLHGRRTETKA